MIGQSILDLAKVIQENELEQCDILILYYHQDDNPYVTAIVNVDGEETPIVLDGRGWKNTSTS